MGHSICSGEPNFLSNIVGDYILYNLNSCSKWKQMAALSSWIHLHFSAVPRWWVEKGTRNCCFPIVFLQVHRALITPTHMLARAYSAHLCQNATSISAHLNLPTYRFCAAAYKGLVIQLCTWHGLTVIAIISGCNYWTLKDIYNVFSRTKRERQTGQGRVHRASSQQHRRNNSFQTSVSIYYIQ